MGRRMNGREMRNIEDCGGCESKDGGLVRDKMGIVQGRTEIKGDHLVSKILQDE